VFAVKVNDVLGGVWLGGECLCRVLVVLASDAALLFAVQVQQITHGLFEIPECVHSSITAEMRGLKVGNWDVEHELSAASQFAQQGFAVEKPRVWKFLWRSGHGAILLGAIQKSSLNAGVWR
jgi:hypothetical protein